MKFKLYLDLDGVLVNFDKKITELYFNYYNVKSTIDNITYKQGQEIIRTYNARGGNFFEDLELYPDAKEFVNKCLSLKSTEVEILTAVGFDKMAETTYKQKIAFVKKHFGDIKVNISNSGASKEKYSEEQTILVDDSFIAVTEFNKKSGLALIFNNKNVNEWGEMFDYINSLVGGDVNYENGLIYGVNKK